MVVVSVIGCRLVIKCMPNEINVVGVHVDIYVYLYDMYACAIQA